MNAAELGSSINASAAEAEFEAAQQAAASFEGQATSPDKLKAADALDRARARFQATKAG